MASDDSSKKSKLNSDISYTDQPSAVHQTGSSVWNICDTQAVDLRDITPSLSPVFTEDQVRELSGQTGDLDVLGDNFLHHDTFKRITEELSPEQTNMLISTCKSLCSESDGLTYTDPAVGSVGHFKSQHVSTLNTPPDKLTKTPIANSTTTKTDEEDSNQQQETAKSLVCGETECTSQANTDINSKSADEEKKDEKALSDKETKSDKIKSTYSLRGSPRKSAKEEKSAARSPSRNARQKSKEPVRQTERRKSPRGQKLNTQKEETPLSIEKTSPERKGRQKEQQKKPECSKDAGENKEEGMSLRRSSRIQRHDVSPVKPKTQSPRKGRGGRRKATLEPEVSNDKAEELEETHKPTDTKTKDNTDSDKKTIQEKMDNKNDTFEEKTSKDASDDTKSEDVEKHDDIPKDSLENQGTASVTNSELPENTELERLPSKDKEKSVASNVIPSKDVFTAGKDEESQASKDLAGEETVVSSLIPSRDESVVSKEESISKEPLGEEMVESNLIHPVDGSEAVKLIPTVDDTNLIPTVTDTVGPSFIPSYLGTVETSMIPTGVVTVGTSMIPAAVGTVGTSMIPTGVGTVGTNVTTTVSSDLIPIGVGSVDDSLLPTREGLLDHDVKDILTVEKDILEIIQKEISLPDNVDLFENKDNTNKTSEEVLKTDETQNVQETKKSDTDDSQSAEESRKTDGKQAAKRKSASKKDLQPSRRSNRISESIQKREIEAAVKKAQEEMLKEREEQERLEREEEERKRKEEEEKNKKEEEAKEEKKQQEEELKEEKKETKEKESPKKKVIKKKDKTQEEKPKETKKTKDQHEKKSKLSEQKSKEQPDTTQKDKGKTTHPRKPSTDKKVERKRTNSESNTLFSVGGDHEKYSKVKHKRLSSENEQSEKDKKEDMSSSEDDSDSSEHIDEDDSDYDPEYDPERLWCICRKPHGNRFMICCDACEEWLHGDCVSITKEIGKEMEKNGIEYICPRCVIARKKLKEQGIDPEKQKETGETKPKKRRHRRLKIPGEKRHRHSSDSTKKTEKKRRESHEKKSKDDSHKDNKRKSIDASSFYKIPKKVRTTPTPASFSSRTQRTCINTGCDNHAEIHSVYCSDKCITKHAHEAINLLHEERKKRSATSHKPTSSHSSSGGVLNPWETSHPRTPTSPQIKERVAVIERSTGRVIAGVAAPAEQDLIHWLHRHPTFEVIKPSVSKEIKRKDRKEEEKAIRDNVKRTLKEILSSRLKEVPELKLTPDDVSKFSVNIEEDLYRLFGEAGPRYKSKYRSLAFNLKDFRNKVLFYHVLNGEVPTDKLVMMTAEQLASQELASWRERETRHTIEMIKKNQLDINISKGHIKKTHKGEVELDEDEDLSILETRTPSKEKEKSEIAEPDSNTSPGPMLVDTTEQHRIHLFDLNCRICTGKMQPPGEPPRQEDTLMLVSTTTPIQAIAESSVPSPPPLSVDITSVSSTDSFDVPSVSPPAPVKPVKREKPVWKGYIMMQSVSKFSTNAYKVSGPCDDLLHLLPDTLHLQGRIGFKQVWDYISQLRHSTTRDVSVIRYEVSSDEEKTSYVSLYSYFYSRKRCGVVSNCYTGVKDMYLMPLASHSPIPAELLPFDGPGLDEPRPHMLLGIIVRTKAHFKRPRPVHHRSSSSPTPKRRHGSSRSSEESQTKDSPPREIEDIVFYNKRTSVESKPVLSPSSGSSEHSSAVSSPSLNTSSGAATTDASGPSPKEELQDLADRAKQYIASALKAKQEAEQKDQKETKMEDSKDDDEDKPYDPEEDFDLDLELEKPIDDPKTTKAPLEPTDVTSTEILKQKVERKDSEQEHTGKESTTKTVTQTNSIQKQDTVSSSTATPHAPPSIFMPITSTAPKATTSSSALQLTSTSKIPQLPIASTELAGIVKLLQQANSQSPSQTQTGTFKVTTSTSGTSTTLTKDNREDQGGKPEVYDRPRGDDIGGKSIDTSRRSTNTSETDRERIDRERLQWRERRLSKEGPKDQAAHRDDRWSKEGPRDHGPPHENRWSKEGPKDPAVHHGDRWSKEGPRDHGPPHDNRWSKEGPRDHGPPHDNRWSKEGPRDHGAPHNEHWRDQRDRGGPPMRRPSEDRYQGDYRGPHSDRGRHNPYHRGDDRRGDRRVERRDDPRWRERWRR